MLFKTVFHIVCTLGVSFLSLLFFQLKLRSGIICAQVNAKSSQHVLLSSLEKLNDALQKHIQKILKHIVQKSFLVSF